MAKNDSGHFEEIPQDALSMVQLINEFFDLRVTGTPDNSDPTARELLIRMQPDGTVRAYALQVGRDQSGEESLQRNEDDGSPRSQVILWDYTGAAQIRAAGEPTTGEARNILCGKDEGLNVDDYRTDPNRIQWTRPHVEYVSVPSAEIPAAEGDLWSPGLADTVRYRVKFLVANNDAGGAAITGVYVGRDLNAGGGLAAPEYWMFNETIPHPGNSGWRGPFYMHGDDAVRGVAAVANDASIIFDVRRVDLGA